MPHYNLPHNHGQNMERVLNKMPHTEDFTDIAFLFQQLGDPTRLRILWLLCGEPAEPAAYQKDPAGSRRPPGRRRTRMKAKDARTARCAGTEIHFTIIFGIFQMWWNMHFSVMLTRLFRVRLR